MNFRTSARLFFVFCCEVIDVGCRAWFHYIKKLSNSILPENFKRLCISGMAAEPMEEDDSFNDPLPRAVPFPRHSVTQTAAPLSSKPVDSDPDSDDSFETFAPTQTTTGNSLKSSASSTQSTEASNIFENNNEKLIFFSFSEPPPVQFPPPSKNPPKHVHQQNVSSENN